MRRFIDGKWNSLQRRVKFLAFDSAGANISYDTRLSNDMEPFSVITAMLLLRTNNL